MIKLNLTANCVEHDVLKQFLEENASQELADKINDGGDIPDGAFDKGELFGRMGAVCRRDLSCADRGKLSCKLSVCFW